MQNSQSSINNGRFIPLGKSPTGKSNLSEWKKTLKIYLSREIGELADAILYTVNGIRAIHPDYATVTVPDYPNNTPPGVKLQRDEEYKASFKRVNLLRAKASTIVAALISKDCITDATLTSLRTKNTSRYV